MPSKQLSGSRRRSCARIQQRNVHFPFRKRSVDEWQIPDYCREETETEARFCHNKYACQTRLRDDVAEPQGKESRSAQINVSRETWLPARLSEFDPRKR